ncbi:ATP-binding protein [Deinococcus altitudinis]|uniref:ATP-binding protein n=1 Tax=Deinococcus altitudinis TaxID=468914 RepID=UPI0038919647
MISSPGADFGPFAPLAQNLQEITEALAATTTQREVIEIVLTPAVRALGAVAGIVLLVDQADQQMRIAGSQGYQDGVPTLWQDGPVEQNALIADILRMKEARYFEDAGELKAAYPQLERRTGGLLPVANATLPMFLDHQPLGVIVLDFTEPHTFTPVERRFLTILSGQCAVALGRAEATRTLEARVEERTRQLEEQTGQLQAQTEQLQAQARQLEERTRQLEDERTALEAFTRFTEVVGSETDVQVLVQQAITLLRDVSAADAVYLERGGELFRATVWNPQFDAGLLTRLQAGFPLRQSSLALALRENHAAFIDHWDAAAQWIEESGHLRAVAGYPFFRDGEMESVLLVGLRTSDVWGERPKGIFRAVGRSLDLALDRARQARTVTAQRDALDVRTRLLEDSTQELQSFSYSVSHDLRTPVRHMIGFLHLARKSLGDRLDERSAHHLGVVEQAGGQMNTLIDALLDVARAAQQALRPTAVDLNALMAQVQAGLTPDLMTRNVQWEVASLPTVQGDWDALKQVLTQLTENALKFTRTRDPATIRVWAEDQGEAWGVFVRDNGLGFDPHYQDRLFNLFQRLHTTDEASGTGVGLASVRRLILKHGGRVTAEGQVGEGATFGFTLPKVGPATL